FGDRNSLQVEVTEYGDNYLGIEIVGKEQPPIPLAPTVPRPPEPQIQNMQPEKGAQTSPAPGPQENTSAAAPKPTTTSAGATISVKVPAASPLILIKAQWARTKG